MYELVEEYIYYLVERNQEIPEMMDPIVRTMTSFTSTEPTLKRAKLDLDLGDPVEEGAGNVMEIDCSLKSTGKADTFSLKYNMIMLVLEKLCGFRVRTYILEDENKDPKS
jgi:hypothetical protein